MFLFAETACLFLELPVDWCSLLLVLSSKQQFSQGTECTRGTSCEEKAHVRQRTKSPSSSYWHYDLTCSPCQRDLTHSDHCACSKIVKELHLLSSCSKLLLAKILQRASQASRQWLHVQRVSQNCSTTVNPGLCPVSF